MTYLEKVSDKIRQLIKLDLCRIQKQTQKEDEQFYFTVVTEPGYGVELPDWLRKLYPCKLTIILQHRFEDLVVNDDGFSVVLYFNEEPAKISVPYSAIANFFNSKTGVVITIGSEGQLFSVRKAAAALLVKTFKKKSDGAKKKNEPPKPAISPFIQFPSKTK